MFAGLVRDPLRLVAFRAKRIALEVPARNIGASPAYSLSYRPHGVGVDPKTLSDSSYISLSSQEPAPVCERAGHEISLSLTGEEIVAYMRMPYRPSRRADAGMSTLRASTGMSSLSAGAGISPLSAGAGISPLRAGAGMSPLRAGAGMSSPRASNWQPLEYIETPVWP